MRKNLIIFICLAIVGFYGCKKEEPVAIDIGGVPISPQEFQDAFNASRYVFRKDRAREAFLEAYITKRLILKEAEMMGLDKDPKFLQDIQMYWEQGLLKLVIAKKSKSIASAVKVDDAEIAAYYQTYKDSDLRGKELPVVKEQIRGILLNEKKQKAMLDWMDSLRAKTDVKIDYPLLGIKE